MPETVIIGLGSNLSQPARNVQTAFATLCALDGVETPLLSHLYLTPPFGIQDQPEFVNAVAKLQTNMDPRAVLDALLLIEEKMGRVRKEKWGPRLIDLDLLFFGDQIIDEEGLEIPHPGIQERDFVLVPLLDIAPEWRHPILGKSIRDLASALPDTASVVKIESDI